MAAAADAIGFICLARVGDFRDYERAAACHVDMDKQAVLDTLGQMPYYKGFIPTEGHIACRVFYMGASPPPDAVEDTTSALERATKDGTELTGELTIREVLRLRPADKALQKVYLRIFVPAVTESAHAPSRASSSTVASPVERAMSKASTTLMRSVTSALQVVLSSSVADAPPVACAPFGWRGPARADGVEPTLMNEETASPALLEALEATMPKELRALDCKFVDVRRAKLRLRVVSESDETNAILKGHSDAAISHSGAMRSNLHSCIDLACALVVWKTIAAMKNDGDVEPQLVAQLLAFKANTRRSDPLMVAATDMASKFRVWLIRGSSIIEYRSRADEAAMSLEEALGVFWALFPACYDALDNWKREQMVRPLALVPAEDDDDEDESVEPPRSLSSSDGAGSGTGPTSASASSGPVAGGAGGPSAEPTSVGARKAGHAALSPVSSSTANRGQQLQQLRRMEAMQGAVRCARTLRGSLGKAVADELSKMMGGIDF